MIDSPLSKELRRCIVDKRFNCCRAISCLQCPKSDKSIQKNQKQTKF